MCICHNVIIFLLFSIVISLVKDTQGQLSIEVCRTPKIIDRFPGGQDVLCKYDILFIVDEVICGFGRTGEMFGSQTFGLKPDTISLAKAITSAYAPLGAITVSEDVYQAMLDESRKIGTFGHGYTY